jgi:hypothetical protein
VGFFEDGRLHEQSLRTSSSPRVVSLSSSGGEGWERRLFISSTSNFTDAAPHLIRFACGIAFL